MTVRLWACRRCRYVVATVDGIDPKAVPTFPCEVCRLSLGLPYLAQSTWEAVRLIDVVEVPHR